MTHSDVGMYDCEEVDEIITIGNGQSIKATKIGKKKVKIFQEKGKDLYAVLENVKYVPKLAPYNLFSITTAIDNGYKLGNKGRKLTLMKNGNKIVFDQEVKTKSGYVAGIKIQSMEYKAGREEGHLGFPTLTIGKKVDVNVFHQLLGHVSETVTRQTAKYYGVELEGDFNTCEECALAKARQKNLGHVDFLKRSKNPGERLFIDISSIKEPSVGGAKFWLLGVDDATDFCWSSFLNRKSETKDKIMSLINSLNNKKRRVKFIRCDNAGENEKLEKACEREGLNIKFEYTARNTPQQNGRVERKFATLYGRVRAMLNEGHFPEPMRYGLWAECAATATKKENLTVGAHDKFPPHTLMYDEQSKLFWKFRTFGEMAIVTKTENIQNKLNNKGIIAMFVGYASNHANDVYRMYNIETKGIITTRDVRWLNKNYHEWKNEKERKHLTVPIANMATLNNKRTPSENKQDEKTQSTPGTPNMKWVRELKKLDGIWYNKEVDKLIQEAYGGEEEYEGSENEGELSTTAMNEVISDLFGDVGLLVNENLLTEKPTTEEFQIDSNRHILDQLDEAMDMNFPMRDE